MLRVTVNVTVAPTLGVALSTLWLNPRSASCGVIVAAALLLFGLRSNWSAALMLLVLVLAPGVATLAWSVSVAVPLSATAPTLQRPVPPA